MDSMDRSVDPVSDSNEELIESLKAELDVLIRKYREVMDVYDDFDDSTDASLAAASNAVVVAQSGQSQTETAMQKIDSLIENFDTEEE